jgi:hypothetical protein
LHTYMATCYTLSLRGSEEFLLDLGGLNQKLTAGGDKYVAMALLRQIKGEPGDRAHLLPCVPITSLGIEIKTSLLHLLEFKRMRSCIPGPAISDLAGNSLSHRALNDSLLCNVQEIVRHPQGVIPAFSRRKRNAANKSPSLSDSQTNF